MRDEVRTLSVRENGRNDVLQKREKRGRGGEDISGAESAIPSVRLSGDILTSRQAGFPMQVAFVVPTS